MTPQPLLLASSSPARQALLARLKLPFSTLNPALDESPLPGELPLATSLRLSEAKARAGAIDYPDALIIGSDQLAILGDAVFGKPGTHENAILQLKRLSGQTVNFVTGLCLFNARTEKVQLTSVETRVTFCHLSEMEIENYLQKEQPYHCAGSAKCEGLGIAIIKKIESDDPTALIGLPLITLCTFLREEGFPLFQRTL